MKFRCQNSVICFCLTLALSVLSAQAQDTYNPQGNSLAFSRQSQDTKSLSHYIVGAYHESLGDFDGALREYRESLETDSESSVLHLGLASVFIQKDNPAEAIKELKQSIALDPEAVQPHALMALIYAAGNKPDSATEEYALALENATKSEPGNIEIYKGLGSVYLQQKKLKQAEGIFKLVINIAPADPEAYYYLGSVYYELKDYSSTEKELKNAIKLKPDYHEALNFLGYFYLEQDKNIDQAGTMIEQALSLGPENGAYLDSLGWFYFKKGKFKEALSYLEKAASFLSDPEIYGHLGDVFFKLGNLDNAKLNWEKSLKLDPQQDAVKAKLLKLINHGK
ncbi:MAG: tetratricopeptide repeat protein [Candidatus Omnitrophica bacterium]|nr:tetratricopeptide repeat protein [Candidatus Omnitrophota bacterium]